MATYYLAFRPCAELIGESGNRTTTFVLPRAQAATATLRHDGALETDLVSFAATLTNEVQRIGADIGRCLTSKTSTALFLLTSGGLVVYLVLRWRGHDPLSTLEGSPSPAQTPTEDPDSSASTRIYNQVKSWLQWFFQEDELLDGPGAAADFMVEGEYFGPEKPPSQSAKTHRKSLPYIAPCPNCIKGVCKLKKHHGKSLNKLAVPEVSSYTNSPLKMNSSATPYNADDEHSDLELEEDSLPFINCSRINSTFQSGQKRRCKTKQSARVPPEGIDPISPVLPPAEFNLSCGDVNCKDSFCLSQRRRFSREESTDSIAGVSGSMLDLVKGAREIRRLIREASLDSVASDLSLRLNEDLGGSVQSDMDKLSSEIASLRMSCDQMTANLDDLPDGAGSVLHSKSDYSVANKASETSDQETLDGSSPDLRARLKHPKASNRRMWRISAPVSDFDSPQHKTTTTTDDESNLEWESPNRGWHDVLAKRRGVSRSCSVVTTSDDNLDNLEWDSEGLGHDVSASYSIPMTGHESWLPSDSNELDWEKELMASSANSSRRSSDVSIRHQVRLPPSGRSSVAKGPSPAMTPSTSMDKELLNLSLSSPADPSFIMNRFNGLKRSPSGSSLKPQYYKSRRNSNSSEESGVQDMERSFETATNNGSSYSVGTCATTPLSPVHEAKEPRSTVTSPMNENVTLISRLHPDATVKRNILLQKGFDESEDEANLPDLEPIVSPLKVQ